MKSGIRLLSYLWALALIGSPGVTRAQESVDVPQLLQKDVHTFKLAIDSLENLASNIRDHSKATMQDLKMIQQQMQVLPRGSNKYRLQHKQYEKKLSDYWASKFRMLHEMQDVRQQTLASLDNVLEQLPSSNNRTDTQLLQQAQEEIRKADDQISQTQLAMLNILEKLKDPDLNSAQKGRLTRKFQLLQYENLALYRRHRQRLNDLHKLAEQPNAELPATELALLTIRDDLESGYAWVDTELAYLSLYANYRRSWLDIDAMLLEVSGLVERFSDIVNNINENRDLMGEVEEFERQLRPLPDTSALAIKLPPIQWPGKQTRPSKIRQFTSSEIDSLREMLERELNLAPGNQAQK